MSEPQTIGQFLKQWRDRSGLSQEEIANLTRHKGKGKWTKSYISLVENDRTSTKGAPPRPSPEKLRAICEVIGAPFEKAMQLTYGTMTTPESTEAVSDSETEILKQEAELNAMFRHLPPDRRDDIIAQVKALYIRYAKEGQKEPTQPHVINIDDEDS